MTQIEELNFEQALQELEAIVAELESGELALDDMLAQLKEHCVAMLEKAEARIRELINHEGDTEPFTARDSNEENA